MILEYIARECDEQFCTAVPDLLLIAHDDACDPPTRIAFCCRAHESDRRALLTRRLDETRVSGVMPNPRIVARAVLANEVFTQADIRTLAREILS